METITIKNSIVKNLTFLLSSLCFIALSLFFFYFPDQPIFNYLGGFGLLFFGFLTFAFFAQVFDREPRLIINSEGISDRTLKTGVIGWYDIKNVYLQKMGNSRFVCLVIEDEEKYLLGNHQESKKVSFIKNHLAMETINKNIDGLDIEDIELIKVLKTEIAKHETSPKPVSLFDYLDE